MKTLLRRSSLAAFALVLAAPSARPDEGMWLLTQIKNLALEAKGLQIDPAELYQPGGPSLAQAIVQIDGGTGEFVSAEGLILTNHHVVFDGVQQVSAEGRNYVDDGFLARTRGEELNVTGYDAIITQSVVEVTERVLDGLAADAGEDQRGDHVAGRVKEIVAEAKATHGDHLRYDVLEHFNGARLFLYTRLVLPDMRLVYAPPKAIGEFGGDIDNFMWPRHCADFGFLRAYIGPDGKPAEPSSDNVPYKPQRWLKISTEGVEPGDFTFVMGHPGATMRERTAYSMRYNRDYQLPMQVAQFEAFIAQLEEASKASEAAYLENISQIKGIANAIKNYAGKVEGMKARGLVEIKSEQDDALRQFIAASEGGNNWDEIFPRLAQIYAVLPYRAEYKSALDKLSRTDIYRLANRVYRMNLAKALPDSERPRRYREDRWERLMEAALKDLERMDRQEALEEWGAAFALFAAIPDEGLPQELRTVTAGHSGIAREQTLAGFARGLATASGLNSSDRMIAWMKADANDDLGFEDPLMQVLKRTTEVRTKLLSDAGLGVELTALRRGLYHARAAMSESPLYPDANSTLRFTYGYVEGYSPRDAVSFAPVTTLAGVLEKETGVDPFASPPKLLEVARSGEYGRWADPRHGGSVPVAFTHTVDITGGNSGSPALNAKGELIGIVFDGNIESLTADYIYDSTLTRCISVDIRYCLFVLEKFDGATALLAELGF